MMYSDFSDDVFLLVPFIFVAIFFVIILLAATQNNRNQMATKKRIPTRASDGHVVPKREDATCEQLYGHNHGPAAPRYIVHEEPESGYVILNGVKRRIKDCAKL